MTETLIVDGYNIIHAIPELDIELDKSLKNAREALEEALRQYQAAEKSIKRIYVIYDSKGNDGEEMVDLGLVKNIYTHSESNADREIVSILKKAARPARIAVLSRDNFVINHTRAMGANVLSIDAFYKKTARSRERARDSGVSEEQKAEINRELKKAWLTS